MGSETSEFLILKGKVVKVPEISEINTSIPSYAMRLSRAWWLDEDQERKEINLGFLDPQIRKDLMDQGQKHLKNR